MRFWRNDRLVAEASFELPAELVVAQFIASSWSQAALPLHDQMRGFLTDQAGPVRAVWNDAADLARLCELARTRSSTFGVSS
jgi:hypothetical protein